MPSKAPERFLLQAAFDTLFREASGLETPPVTLKRCCLLLAHQTVSISYVSISSYDELVFFIIIS